MEQIVTDDFHVDIERRAVMHKSGVEFEFYPYERDEDYQRRSFLQSGRPS